MAVKAETNATVTYNSNALTAYCNQADVAAAIDQLDVTDLASTAKESLTGFAEWTISLGGFWDATIDGYLAPDAVTPGTKRTAVIAYNDDTTTVTYTWTSNAEIRNYNISAQVGSPLTWTAELMLSGAPGRATS